MPFQEIDIDKILKEKSKSDPEFEKDFRNIEAELDVVAQIVKARKQRGLSQKDVANKAGVTQQVVSRVENRSYSPNLKNLVKITNALELEIKLVNMSSQLTEHSGINR